MISLPLFFGGCDSKDRPTLEGILVKESFLPKHRRFMGVVKAEYLMVVELPEGNRRAFEYDGDRATKMYGSYVIGDPVKWKQGRKPRLPSN